MTLWFLFALMTAAAVLAVLWPLRSGRTPAAAGTDLAVYRDQLEEIERDHAAGLIGTAEAEAARVEVSRRLLAAADAAEGAPRRPPAAGLGRRRATALAALILLPLGAGAIYVVLGSPELPGQPLAERREQGQGRSLASLVAQVEAHLESNPEDGRGWEVVAPVYMRAGRYDDAVKARRNALRLLGANAEREADYGEALVAAANGVVTADAKSAFERATARDAEHVRARFYLGLSAEQDGNREKAAGIFRDLLARAPAGAPWVAFVQTALTRVGGGDVAASSAPGPSGPKAPGPGAAPNAPGPSAEDMAAAAQMSEGERGEMIRGMVARLAERLKSDGSDPDGWLRLVRAYMVLGDRDKARAAAGDARRALTNEPDKLRRLEDGVKQLGLEG